MNKFAKLLTIFASILCCCGFSACSTINVSIYLYQDGSITQAYEVTLEPTELDSMGINKDDLLSQIDSVINTQWTNVSNDKDLTGITVNTQNATNGRLFTITFASYKDYAKFYEIDDSSNTKRNVQKGLYVNKYIIFDGNSTYTNTLNTQIYTTLSTYIANTYFDGDTSKLSAYFDDITVGTTYVYPTTYRTNSNATYHRIIDNYDIYIWESTLAQEVSDSPQNIKIWQSVYTNENRLAWYLTAIVATFVFGGILFGVLYLKKRNKKTIHNIDDPTSPQNNFNTGQNVENQN